MPKVNKWFQSGKPLNWKASDSQTKRRSAALKSRKGKLLPAARALQALSNVSRDKETSRKASADARYFFAQYKKQQDREKK